MTSSKESKRRHREGHGSRAAETGSTDCGDGLGVILDLIAELGVPEGSVFLYDPAGSIDYNRASALAHVTVLRAAIDTEWGEAWHDALPIAGVDGSTGTLGKGTSPEGKIQAKTGTRGSPYPARDSISSSGRPSPGTRPPTTAVNSCSPRS